MLGRVTDKIERKAIFALIGDLNGQTILDMGCGDGELAVELWRRGAKVTGIDASAQMIAAARARARRDGADIDFTVATGQNLPFAPDTFDIVVTVAVLCFVEEPTSVLQEATRVLRPGGRLVIGELGRWSIWAAIRRIRGWLGHPLWRRARFRTASDFGLLVTEAGLLFEASRGAIYYPPNRLAARLFGPLDHQVSRLTTFGAAFLTVAATKPTTE